MSRAISIFFSTRFPNHSVRGDKNSHHQEPGARASPFFSSHRTSCLPGPEEPPALLCRGLGTCAVTTHSNPHQTPFFWRKKKIKISTSAAVVAMEALKPSLCVAPGSSCPYSFMGLAVLMLQCLLAALAEGKKKEEERKNRHTTGKTGENAPIATLAEAERVGRARIRGSSRAAGWSSLLRMSSTIQRVPQCGCRCSIATVESLSCAKPDRPPLAIPHQSVARL